MLYRKNNQWHLCLFKIIYNQHGQRFEQFTDNKKWWLDFADMWEHTQIVEIIGVTHSHEQLSRYEDIKDMPEDFSNIYSEYVANGAYPEDSTLTKHHPFQVVRLTKENERLGVELSQREINEIIHGIQLSDLEIRLMMGGL